MMDANVKGTIKNIIFYLIRVVLLGLFFSLILTNIQIIDYYFYPSLRGDERYYHAEIKDMIIPMVLLIIVIILIFFCNYLFNKKSYSYSKKISIKTQSLLGWILAIFPSFVLAFILAWGPLDYYFIEPLGHFVPGG